MRSIAVLLALSFTACSRTDQDRARDNARRTADQLKVQGRQALHEGERVAGEASREIDQGLKTTRRKVRRAIDAPHSDDRDR